MCEINIKINKRQALGNMLIEILRRTWEENVEMFFEKVVSWKIAQYHC
jgi:hypothetical protein